MYRVIFLLLVIRCLNPVIGLAQQHAPLQYVHYDYQDGLLINPVDVILQDHQGYMWFGSKYGLCRFDGYEFTTYTHNPDDPYSLPHNHINDLAEDREGNLWIATNNGLAKFDSSQELIERIVFPQYVTHSPVVYSSLYMDEHNQIWIGGDSNLLCLNLQSQMVKEYPFIKKPEQHTNSITEICGDNNGTIWFAKTNSLFQLDSKTGQTIKYQQMPLSSGYSEKERRDFQSTVVYDIYKDENEVMWFGTWGGGLTRFNTKRKEIFTYPFHHQYTNSIHKTVNSIVEGLDSIIWLATDNGLCRLNPKTNSIIYDLPDPSNPNGLSSKRIRTIYKERTGAIWVATDIQLHRYEPTQNSFQFLVYNPHDPNSLGANPVYSMCEGLDGLIWFGTHYGGLNSYDPDSQIIKSYFHDPDDPLSLSDNTVTALSTDPSGKIWIGTWTKGICLFDPKTEIFQRFPFTRNQNGDPQGKAVVGSTIRAIEIDSHGNVWFGTPDYTISIYNPQTQRFRYLVGDLPNPFTPDFKGIYSLCNDQKGNMWIGTGNYGPGYPGMGLYKYDPNSESFHFFDIRDGENGIWGTEISGMYESQNGDMWFATEHGITHLDAANNHFTDYYPTDGFWGKVTASVLEANDGSIWVSTKNFGLSMMNPQTKEVRNFGKAYGLNNVEYLSGSALKGSDGTLYFGGMDGVTIVPDGTLNTNPNIPSVIIDHCQVLDNPISQSIIQSQTLLRLSHRQNSIQFEFLALNFTYPDKNQYQYRLLGLNKKWVDADSSRSASFSYLPPGTYTFEVKGSNNDGVWNPKPASFQFSIAPPFWQTWWFRAIAFVILVLIISSFFYLRIRSIRIRNKQLEEQVHARTLSLRKEKEHSDNILKKSPSIIFGFKSSGNLTFINPMGEQYLQCASEEVIHSLWWDLFPNPSDRIKLQDIHQKLKTKDIVDQETTISYFDNNKRSMIWSFIRHEDEERNELEFIAFGNDVTEKMEHEILEASTRAQRNIGREIHDGICQSLTGIYCLNEAIARNQDDPSSPNALLIERMKQHVQDVTVQSRNIARSLYLDELEHIGLKQALQELTKKIENLFQVKCRFTCEIELPEFDFNMATHIYRIAQEAINNAVKYSGADKVDLRIGNGDGQLLMTVEDRGKGFVPNQNEHKGMGLNIMKYRARMIKADFSIDSQPGKGTIVRCMIP